LVHARGRGEPGAAAAPLQAEQATSEAGPPKPHWFFVYDVNFLGSHSKVYLYDGDSGSMLVCCRPARSATPSNSRRISLRSTPEITPGRGSRGDRTDIVAIYDTTAGRPSAKS
jgi:hypothetical protein